MTLKKSLHVDTIPGWIGDGVEIGTTARGCGSPHWRAAYRTTGSRCLARETNGEATWIRRKTVIGATGQTTAVTLHCRINCIEFGQA